MFDARRLLTWIPGACLALGLMVPAAAFAAQDGSAPSTRLDPAETRPADRIDTTGVPIELAIVKSRGGQAVVGERVEWVLDDPDAGRLEVLDEATRAASDGVAAGSARARYIPRSEGAHGVTARSLLDPACTGDACEWVSHRFELRAADAASDERRGPSSRVIAAGVLGVAAIAAIAAADDDDPVQRTLAVVSGNGQTGFPNSPLAAPLEVLALDNGRAREGVSIRWTASGGATLSSATSVTGPDGIARITVTNLGPSPGTVTVTATRADRIESTVSFALVVAQPGLDKVSGDNQTTPVNTQTAAPLVVRTTMNGSPQANVTVTWQVVEGAATIVGGGASNGSGLAQVFVDVGPADGTIVVVARRGDAPSISQTFTINAIDLRGLVIHAGDNQSAAQGQPLPAPLVVEATVSGASEPGVTILWSASGGAVLSTNSSVTDGAGLASVDVVDVGYGLDPIVVTATRADNPSISVQFMINVDPSTLTVVAGDGQSGLITTDAVQPIQVRLLDGAGNPMAGQNINWTVTNGSATVTPPVSVTDGAGIATANFNYGSFAGPVEITASAFSGHVTAVLTATAVAPSGLIKLTGDGQTGDPGDTLPIPLRVRIADLFPNLEGIPIFFTVISGSASVTQSSTVSDLNGEAETDLVLGLTPGVVVVQAQASGGATAQFTATITGTLVVTALAIVSGDDQTLQTGAASQPMVVKLTHLGAPLAGKTIDWITSNGAVANPTTVTDANGEARTTVTPSGAGPITVTASFASFAEFVGSSVAFNHNGTLASIPGLPTNETSVAIALDQACAALQSGGTLSPSEADLVAQCVALAAASNSDAGAVQEALGEMLPDVAQTQADASQTAVNAQFNNLNARIMTLRSGAPLAQMSFSGLWMAMAGGRVPLGDLGLSLMAADGDEVPEVGAEFERWGFFVSGTIGRGESDPTDLTPRFDLDVDGITAGIDYRWSDSLVVGAALGYTRQDTTLAGGQGSVDVNGFSLSGYTTWYRGDWYLDGVVTWGSNRFDHSRAIQYVLPGSVVNQTAQADSDGTDTSATLTFGRDFQVKGWTLGAYGRGAWNRLGFDGFSEEVDPSLAGSGLALRVAARTVTGLSTSLGGRASKAYSRDWGVLMPQFEVEWRHEYRDDAEAFRAFFVDDPTGTPIVVLGDALDSDYFRIGMGLAATFTHGRSGFFNYERILGRSGVSHQSISIGFRWEF